MGTPEQDLAVYLKREDAETQLADAVERWVGQRWADGAHIDISLFEVKNHRAVWQWSLMDTDGQTIAGGDGDYDSMEAAARDAEANADNALADMAYDILTKGD